MVTRAGNGNGNGSCTAAAAGAGAEAETGGVTGSAAAIATDVESGAGTGVAAAIAAGAAAACVCTGAVSRAGPRLWAATLRDGFGATAGGAVTGPAGKSAGGSTGSATTVAGTGAAAGAGAGATTLSKQPAASSSSMEMPRRSIWTRIQTMAATFLTSAGTEEGMAEDTINAGNWGGKMVEDAMLAAHRSS
ncbi:hypothetical protein ACU4GI_24870 [Cupriavidus basilensis]